MDEKLLYILAPLIVFLSIMIAFIVSYVTSPFSFPYKKITFDVTGSRLPKINDYIDEYLIKHRMLAINSQINDLNTWKNSCVAQIQKSLFKKRRLHQYKSCLDEENMFVFVFVREKTKYKQVNYVRYPYKVLVTVEEFSCSFEFLADRYKQLEDINFVTTLSDYHSKNQRSLMTKELRESIAVRDNYTCQSCGKQMFDGVGLHIDHIIPIAKGGKSIPSNLQVLCSKCNGKKSSKTVDENSYENNYAHTTESISSSYAGGKHWSDHHCSIEENNYNNDYIDSLRKIENQIIEAYQNNDIDTAALLLNNAENLSRRTFKNSVSLHFFYQDLADFIYSIRATYIDAIDDCIYICDKDIALIASINFGAGCSITTVTRKAIILEKEKEYLKAIELCDYAIKKDYLDNKKSFSIRKARLVSKLEESKA